VFSFSAAARADLVRLDTDTPLRAVYLAADPESARLALYAVFIAGEADFTGPEGQSHYLEHIMYGHADAAAGQSLQARYGNAWVNGIITAYLNHGEPSDFATMLTFARRLLDPPALDTRFMLDERAIVAREYDLTVAENPDFKVFGRMRRMLMLDHPLSRDVIGTPESIASFTLDDALAFHGRYYNPSNLVLLIGGDIDAATVVATVEAGFAGLTAGAENQQPWRNQTVAGALDATIDYSDRHVVSDNAKYAVLADWEGTGDPAQDRIVAEVAQELMRSALPGSVSKPLRMDAFIVSSYGIAIEQQVRGQIELWFSGSADADISPEQVGRAVRSALSDIAISGIPAESIDRIRRRLVQTAERRRDDPEFLIGHATASLTDGHMPESVAATIARLQAVTADDVNDLMRALAHANRRVTAHLRKAKTQ